MCKQSIVDLKLFELTQKELSPEDFILKRIRELLHQGELQPGARLPSERLLAETLNTSRGNIRKALQKLEFYGLVEISPQSGTRISSMGQETVEELMKAIPVSRDQKMADLMEARFVLDLQCTRLAAERRSDSDLILIEERQEVFLKKFYSPGNKDYLEEDYLFHLAIAHATGNHVLISLLSQLTPKIVTQEQPHLKQRDKDFSRIPGEHQKIIDAIRLSDPEAAEEAMLSHRQWALKRIFTRDKTGEEN
ncbi:MULTISPECIES: FadR/GntR family transcriptional regulator [unclassified Oceanispirochaeta]|uniref:FadR/GntR family transcriptional regulator n=1 Tax=unclassified Oceanispirochaeta TaxID=2635722 RepID=UPI000E08FB3D|nr:MULTISPECIES: FadR/GntR family transcriptional regulator [unclassified Oceanispirochaeta]MBF9014300.1 FadR family transcriptional regulator [Oceanispirochaeta sp. M2]NPD71186.1 FadR family transcriptional regulator [Oceanispirochaeta sp. M1]RDG33576.1 FadR family transcriptional regulator [Oceanispirochaeta sp. M1]